VPLNASDTKIGFKKSSIPSHMVCSVIVFLTVTKPMLKISFSVKYVPIFANKSNVADFVDG
jgi:hypothetical protein